jgi:hypothetical protein
LRPPHPEPRLQLRLSLPTYTRQSANNHSKLGG